MKLYISFLITLFTVGSIFAQQYPLQSNLDLSKRKVDDRIVRGMKANIANSGTRGSSHYLALDYDGADETYSINNAFDYYRYVWPLNNGFQQADTNTLSWCFVAFDQLVDPTGPLPFVSYPSSESAVRLDSFSLFAAHWNVSGTMDRIIVTVQNMTHNQTTGQVTIGTDIWKDTISTNTSLSPSLNANNIPELITLDFYPNPGTGIQLAKGQTFGIRVDFEGDTTQPNQFMIVAGYNDECGGVCAAAPSTVPYNSYFYGNHGAFSGINEVFADCDQNQQITPGGCEEWFIQNIMLIPFVSVDVDLNVQISGDATTDVCPDDVLSVTATATGGVAPFSYQWTPTTGLTNPFGATTDIIVGTTDVTYKVLVTDANGDTISTYLTVDAEAIMIDAGVDQTVACGQTVDLLMTVSGTTSGASFSWNNGVTTLNNDGVGPGVYTAGAANLYGCTDYDTVVVNAANLSQAVSFQTSGSTCSDSTITFNNTSTNSTGWSWTWDFGDGSIGFTQNATHTYAFTGTYNVTLTADSAGCSLSSSSTIQITNCGNPGSTSCTSPGNLSPGFYPSPNNFPCVTQGVNYNENIIFKNWNLLSIFGQQVVVDSIRFDSITNLPCGLNWQLNTGSTIASSQEACITLSGSTSDPAGFYKLNIIVTLWINGQGFPLQQNADFIGLKYHVKVLSAPGACAVADTTQAGNLSTCNGGGNLLNVSVAASKNPLCLGESSVLTANANGGTSSYTYNWSPATGLNSTSIANPTASPTVTTNYTVIVQDGISADTANIVLVVDTNSLITGQVSQTSGGFLDNTKVLLIEFNSVDSSLAAVDSAVTNANGEYSFTANGGDVYLKVIPDPASYPNLIPTYYNVSTVFQTATAVDVSNCATQSINVTMINGINPGGPGFIGGLISQGAGKQFGPGDPVVGLDLVLVNNSNIPVKYTTTDSDGQFEFDNLALGTYKIWVDKPGIDNSAAPVILLEAGTSEQEDSLGFELMSESLVQVFDVGIKPVAYDFSWDIYPNPAKDMVQLSIVSAGDEQFALSIFNTNGVNVLERAIQTSGTFTGNIDVNDLPQGIYIVKLQSDKGVLVRKLAIH